MIGTTPPTRIPLVHAEPSKIRSGAHHVDIVGFHAAAFDGELLVALVRGDAHIRGPECHPLEPQQRLVEQTALAELGFVHLG